MNLNPATRARILADLTLGIDPEGSTIDIKVDDAWHPAAWLGTATTGMALIDGVAVARWFRTARTTDYFCGPDAVPLAASTVLDLGRHLTKTRVALEGDQLVAESDPIDVR